MIRIGAVNIDTSHPKMFAKILHKGQRARYTAVYNDGFRGDDEVEAFVRDFELEMRCASVEELAERVDIGFIHGCNWDKHLAYLTPFAALGKPVFIDKPVVGTMKDCDRLLEHARQGHVVLGGSSLRYAAEISSFLASPASERGTLLHAYGTCGVDHFNYGIHVVELLCALVGSKPLQVRFAGRSQSGASSCDTYTVRFAGDLAAAYSTVEGPWMPCSLAIVTTKGTVALQIDMGAVYEPLLERICDYMESGSNRCASVEELTDSIKIMLAGRLSAAKDGVPVDPQAVPLDDPGFDGAQFEKSYAAAATKIYLE